MSLPGRVRGMAGTMAKWLPKPDSVAARLLHCKVVTPIGKGFSLGCVPEEAVELSMGSPKNPSAFFHAIDTTSMVNKRL